jgi:hypothetical protein
MVVDSHLSKDQAPIIDMRSLAPRAANDAAVAAPASSASAYPAQPGTSTEGPPPPATNEQAAEESAERARGQQK